MIQTLTVKAPAEYLQALRRCELSHEMLTEIVAFDDVAGAMDLNFEEEDCVCKPGCVTILAYDAIADKNVVIVIDADL